MVSQTSVLSVRPWTADLESVGQIPHCVNELLVWAQTKLSSDILRFFSVRLETCFTGVLK